MIQVPQPIVVSAFPLCQVVSHYIHLIFALYSPILVSEEKEK